MNHSAVPYWLTLFVLIGVAYGGWKVWQVEQDRAYRQMAVLSDPQDLGPPLTEFTLTERSGLAFHSHSLAGQVWAASYFFANCPGVCRQMNQTISMLSKSEDLKQVRFVSITCDPINDTPERLTDYANRFDADPEQWLFCTGEMDYLKRVGNDILGLTVKPKNHAKHLLVVDRAGKVRGQFDLIDSAHVTAAHDLMIQCLAEEPPAKADVDTENSPIDKSTADQSPTDESVSGEERAGAVAKTGIGTADGRSAASSRNQRKIARELRKFSRMKT